MTHNKLLGIGGAAVLVGAVGALFPLADVLDGTAGAAGTTFLAIGMLLLVGGLVATGLGWQARRRDLNRPRTYGEEFDGKPFEDDRPRNPHQFPGAGVQGQPGAGF